MSKPKSTAGVATLVLKRKNLRKTTAELFEQLSKDSSLRSQFIRDPAAVLATKVLKRKLPAQQTSDANRVLFSALANDRFRKWLDGYKSVRNGKKVGKDQFARDFAKALVDYGDPILIKALLRHAADGFGMPGFEVAQQLVTGPEKSVITSPATPSTSDKSANSSQNFNNKQSGIQLGDTTLVNPAMLRAITGQLVAHAKSLKAAGQLG